MLLTKGSVHSDELLLQCIRRAKLDAFWARRPDTVSDTAREFKDHLVACASVGITTRWSRWTPVVLGQDFDDGLEYAVGMLLKSLRPGRDEERVKFSTVRGVRSMGTNVDSMRDGVGESRRVYVSGLNKKVDSTLGTESMWFRRFLAGMEARMGSRLRQDMGLTPEIVVGVLDRCDHEWRDCVERTDLVGAREVAEEALFFVLTYAGGLRGFEVPKVVLTGLGGNFVEAADDIPAHVGIPLTGRFKARGGVTSNLVIFLAQKTNSGVETGVWIRRLVWVLSRFGITGGWLFRTLDGSQVPTSKFRKGFYDRLLELFDRKPHLFPAGVDVKEDYGPIRSGRRGADTQAIKRVSNKTLIDAFFRWNTGGHEASHLPMHILYAERSHLVGAFVKGVSVKL